MITKFDENSKMNRLNYVVRFLIFSKKTFSDIWNKNTSYEGFILDLLHGMIIL